MSETEVAKLPQPQAAAPSESPPSGASPTTTSSVKQVKTSPITLPAGLQRQPSQQELEVARHLTSFQSQGITQAQHPGNVRTIAVENGNSHRRTPSGEEARSIPNEHHNLSDTLQHQGTDPDYPPTTGGLSPSAQHARASSVVPVPGGQICSNCGTTKTPLWRRSPTGAVICNACGLYYKARNQMRPVNLKRGAVPGMPPSLQVPGQPQERGSSPSSLHGGATYVPADQSVNGTCPGGGRCNGTGGHQGCNGCPAYNNRVSKTAQVALRQTNDGQPDPSSNHVDTLLQNYGQSAPQSVIVACQNCGTTITPLWRRDEAGNTICNACGLYHKLHGHHRPVQMKKAEIKRRKRVVPANNATDDQSSVYASEMGDDERALQPLQHFTSPPPAHEHEPLPLPRPLPGGPIPVDFTHAFRRPALPGHHATSDVVTISRKRSYSTSQRGSTSPYNQAQNLASPPTMSSTNENIDPNLPTRGQERSPPPPRAQVSLSSSTKESKRAELQREAERMRRLLSEKEKEIAELGDEVAV